MLLAIVSSVAASVGDPETSLRQISEAGFTHILWGHHWNTDFAYGRHELAAIRSMLKRYSLKIQDVHGCANAEKSFFSPLEYQRKAGIDLIVNRIEMMKELDASGVLVMHQPRIKTDSSQEEIAYKRLQFESLKRSMDELIPILEKMDAKIALENMPGDTWEFQRYLLDTYPADKFGFCFDSGHANIHLRNQLEDCFAYRSRISAVHLHDNNSMSDQHLAPFSGNADWEKIAGIIRDSAYRGILTFELHVKDSVFMNHSYPLNKQPESVMKAYLADAFERCSRFAEMCRR